MIMKIVVSSSRPSISCQSEFNPFQVSDNNSIVAFSALFSFLSLIMKLVACRCVADYLNLLLQSLHQR